MTKGFTTSVILLVLSPVGASTISKGSILDKDSMTGASMLKTSDIPLASMIALNLFDGDICNCDLVLRIALIVCITKDTSRSAYASR